MAQVSPVVEKVTRTRVVSADELAAEKSPMPKVWEYMETMKQEDWPDHIGYLYRVLPKIAGGESYLMKFSEPITMDYVKEKFGGQMFRIILKKGQQRVCDTVFTIEAPPKMQTDQYNYSAPAPAQSSETVRMAEMLNDPTAARTAVNLTQQAATAGFDMLRAQMAQTIGNNQLSLRDIIELLDRRSAPASAMPDWLAQTLAAAVPALITGLVSKLVTPENPIETFKNLAGALQSMPGFGGGKGGSDWKASLVESLPQIAQAGTQMMHEWRVATEAAASTHNRQLPAAPGPHLVPTATVQNPNAPAPLPGSAATVTPRDMPAQPGGSPPPPPEKWLKMKMVEMFRAGRSGEDVGVFLEEIAPMFVEQLAPVPPEQLQGFLRMDPDQILTQIADDPRMLQFLTEFHTWANEIDQAAAVAVATQKPA